jgi:hypothetical protein
MSVQIKSFDLTPILIQTGYGIPDHISPLGSEYTDLYTGFKYYNIDGLTNWVKYNDSSSSGGVFTGGTVSGSTIFTNGLSANTISATTYLNLPSHNNLSGLQGGQTNEYYHLTNSQHIRVLNLIYINNTVSFSVSPNTGERGISTSLTLNYTVTPNDDNITGATINPGSYNVLANVTGLPQTQSVGNFSITTAHILTLGYIRNGFTSTSTNSATYTTYVPQWLGVSATATLSSNVYSVVTALGLTKIVQSSTTLTSGMTSNNQYLWFISNNSNATITSSGLPNVIGAINTEDGVSEWYKKSIVLTLSDGVTTATVYTYRTRELKTITTEIIYQLI